MGKQNETSSPKEPTQKVVVPNRVIIEKGSQIPVSKNPPAPKPKNK